jgi:asparagine synthetase B (glutamine-hydrolysing)
VHGIIAHHGHATDLFRSACETARSLGGSVEVVVDSPTVRLAVIGRGNVVASTPDAVFYGSAAASTARHPSSAATLLDGAADDVVAAGVADGELVLAAGRGNHRLFVTTTPQGDTLASSSLLTVARASGADIDRSYEDFLLGFGFLPGTRTPFTGIQALVGGERRVGPRTETVAPLVVTPNVPTSFSAAVPELRDLFFTALEEYAAGSTRHAVLLGGFDSMLVAAALRSMGHEVHTYTFSFGNPRYEQRNVASFVSSLGITHHPVSFTPRIIADNLATFGRFFFQPGAQAHYQIHTQVASRQIATDGHTSIFNGDGCDAVFLSYPTVNRRAALTRRLSHAPDWMLAAALAPLRTRSAERHLGHVARTARSMLGNLMLDEPMRGHLPTRYLDDSALSLLRRNPQPAQAETIDAIRARLAEAVRGQDGPRRAFHGNGLTAQSKVKVDGSVAVSGVPQFTPYLHPAFRAFVSGLPIDYLKKQDESPAANGKELLVAMVRHYDLLPESIISQPKQSPVDSPIDEWYANDIRAEIVTQLADLPFSWSPNYVDDVLRPKHAEEWYRNKVSIGHHALQVIGLLASYASFNRALFDRALSQ